MVSLRRVSLTGLLVLAACGRPGLDYSILDRASLVANGDSLFQGLLLEMPVDSIAFYRLGGCDTMMCDYTIRLRRDGTAVFTGTGSGRSGEWTRADVTVEFAHIVAHMDKFDLLETMPTNRAANAYDAYTYRLLVWETNQSVARSYTGLWGDGPNEAFILRTALDGVAMSPAWRLAVDSQTFN